MLLSSWEMIKSTFSVSTWMFNMWMEWLQSINLNVQHANRMTPFDWIFVHYACFKGLSDVVHLAKLNFWQFCHKVSAKNLPCGWHSFVLRKPIECHNQSRTELLLSLKEEFLFCRNSRNPWRKLRNQFAPKMNRNLG